MSVQKSLLSPCSFSQRLRQILVLFVSILLLSMSITFFPAHTARAAHSSWYTFRDPVYGFSLMYPDTWTLTPESNGSHITLLNPVTRTTVSPIVTAQTGSSTTVLGQALPASSVGRQTRTVAGHQAIDYLLPYNHGSDVVVGGPQQTRLVVVPVANTSSTTNVYTFLLTQPTNAVGLISPAEQADQHTFEAILSSFTLPRNIVSASVVQAAGSVAGCDRDCWADNNWRYNYYDDSASYYDCDSLGYNEQTLACNGSAVYRAQVPADGNTYYQPYFQCAEFISRALTQDGMIPGLNNGGANGYFPVSSSNSYGNYSASNGTVYHLWNVGVPGIAGLHDYLTDTGLATNVAQNISQVQPGDVVFFWDPASSTKTYTHVMIIVSVNNGAIYMDGHNMASYHQLLGGSSFAIYHFSKAYTYAAPGYDGHLEVFSHGSDNDIWHAGQTAPNSSTWNSNHVILSGYSFNGDPAVGLYQGALQLFARGSDNNIWHLWQTSPNGSWASQWQVLQTGYAFQGTPAVANDANGNIEVFARGSDNRIWHNVYATSWSGWTSL